MPVTMQALTPRGRALAAALRQARKEAKVTATETARRMGISHAAISHWETGRRMPKVEDVATYLAVLDIKGAERDDLIELARSASEPNWLSCGIPGVSQQLSGVMECDRTTVAIADWNPFLINGLLQTSAYARALISTKNSSINEREANVAMRAARRDVLDKRDPAKLLAFVGESALNECFGSIETMVDQLQHLLNPKPSVTVQVMPLGIGWHPGLVGPFTVYDFIKSPTIVYLEHYRTGAFVVDKDDVNDYKCAVIELQEKCFDVDRSKEIIEKQIKQLER